MGQLNVASESENDEEERKEKKKGNSTVAKQQTGIEK